MAKLQPETKQEVIELLKAAKVQVVRVALSDRRVGEDTRVEAMYTDPPFLVPSSQFQHLQHSRAKRHACKKAGYAMVGLRDPTLPLVLDNGVSCGLSAQEEQSITRGTLSRFLQAGMVVLRASTTEPGCLALSYRAAAGSPVEHLLYELWTDERGVATVCNVLSASKQGVATRPEPRTLTSMLGDFSTYAFPSAADVERMLVDLLTTITRVETARGTAIDFVHASANSAV
jgi:hypothetical protein